MSRVPWLSVCLAFACETAPVEVPTLQQGEDREASAMAPTAAPTLAPAAAHAPLAELQRQLTVTPLGLAMLALSDGQQLRVVEAPRHGSLQAAPDAMYYRHRGGGDIDRWVVLVDGRRVVVTVSIQPVPTVTAGADFWLDAAAPGLAQPQDRATLSWPSRSGDAVAVAAGSAPRWDLHGHSRLPALRFGKDDALRVASGPSAGPYTWLAAFRTDPSVTAERPAAVISAFGGRGGLYALGDFAAARCYEPGKATDFVTAPRAMSGWTVVTARWTGHWHELYVDGHLVGALPWAAAPLPGPLLFGKGESSVSDSLQGWLGEALVFNRDLSTTERAGLERYLMGKWGNAATVTGLEGVAVSGTAPCWLVGSESPEQLLGGDGDDVLQGGDGDVLVGGGGADRFVLRDAARVRILDFEPGVDVLDLSALVVDRSVALEDCVSVTPAAAGLLVRAGGAEVLLAGLERVGAGDLETGLETSLSGATELSLEVLAAGDALRVGEPATWAVTARFGPTRKQVVRSDIVLRGNLNVLVRPNGALLPLGPGSLGLVARLGGKELDATNIEALPPRALPFEVEESPPLTTPMAAYQGGTWIDDRLFVTANRQLEGAWLYRIDPDWQVEAETPIPTLRGVPVHVGAVASHGRRLYAPLLDPKSQGAAEPLTGLAVLDADSLEVAEVIDTTGLFRYLDAATVDGDNLWLATTTALVRVPLVAGGPDFEAQQSYVLRGDVGVLQGIAVAGDYVYVVPENGTANPGMLGIVVYRKDDLKPLPALPEFSGVASWFVREWANVPVAMYPVAFPAAKPDHESFFFDPREPGVGLLPYIPGGAHLARLRLQLPTPELLAN